MNPDKSVVFAHDGVPATYIWPFSLHTYTAYASPLDMKATPKADI